jgi:hypothetical protein
MKNPNYSKPRVRARMPGPRYEANFVRRIVTCVRSGRTPWGAMEYLREFEYGTGRTDVLTVVEQSALIAFEAKLQRWRAALFQAYRNRAFASESYVILPWRAAEKAVRYRETFEQYGVGLCTVRNGEIRVLIAGSRESPIQGWLAQRALTSIKDDYAQCVAG